MLVVVWLETARIAGNSVTRLNTSVNACKHMIKMVHKHACKSTTGSAVPSGRQGSSLLWTHTLKAFYNRPIALTQEGRSLVNDGCKCVHD